MKTLLAIFIVILTTAVWALPPTHNQYYWTESDSNYLDHYEIAHSENVAGPWLDIIEIPPGDTSATVAISTFTNNVYMVIRACDTWGNCSTWTPVPPIYTDLSEEPLVLPNPMQGVGRRFVTVTP